MAIAKLILNNTTQMDLTADTVATSDHIMEGYVGHLRNGTSVTGTGKIAASEQASLDALVRYSNEVTGESDETISEAVETLVDGYSNELYPVYTDIVAKYLGRNWSNGNGLFVHGTVTSTGEMTQTDNEEHSGLCMVYIPIDPSYTYVKSDQGRINPGFYYDENKNFISKIVYNNLNWVTFTNIPANAKYFRFATHQLTNNWDIAIYRIA